MKNFLLSILCLFTVINLSAQAETVVLDFEGASTSAPFQYFGSSLDGTFTDPNTFNFFQSPANPSVIVSDFVKPAFSQVWAGAFGFPPIPMDLTNATEICVKVYAFEPGSLALKLEGGTLPNWILQEPITTINEWVEICFDVNEASIEPPFTAAAGGNYAVLVLFFDFGSSYTYDRTYFFDDVIIKGGPVVEDPEPVDAAPSPDVCKNVISMFSNVYDDVLVDTWLTPWSPSGPLTDLQVAGDDVKKYQNVSFLGIETVGPNLIDATSMTHFNIDVWTPNMSVFRVKLVDFGSDLSFGGGDDSEFELSFFPAPETWTTYKIPLADFAGLNSTEHIAQLILSGEPFGGGILYIDNVYYSNDDPVVNVDIVQSDLPEWCQGVKVLTAVVANEADLDGPLSYLWNTGATTPQITAYANGLYSVQVTDNGDPACSYTAYTTVDEDLEDLLSAHTIIVNDEMEMTYSSVVSGGVGVLDADEIDIEDSDIQTFLVSSDANIDDSSVADWIEDDSDLDLPDFMDNNFSDTNNETVPDGGTMTLSGTNYGHIIVGEGATLNIDNGNMFVDKLTMEEGATLNFNQPSNMMVRREMRVDEFCFVNPGGPSVVIYVGNDISIKEGSLVEADLYTTEGLEVNDSGDDETTFMNGLFIADELKSGDNVVWGWNPTCGEVDQADPCENGILVTVTITTDDFPSETTWQITNGGNVVASGGGDYESNTTYVEEICIEEPGCIIFTIFDEFGDGICCGFGAGGYSVAFNGVIVASGGQFGSEESTLFGEDCSDSDCFTDNGTPGCDDAQCQAVVCAVDPFCCDVEWDGLCASQALDLCGSGPEMQSAIGNQEQNIENKVDDLTVFPNPSDGVVNVGVQGYIGSAVDVSITNAMGQQVWFQHIEVLETARIAVDLSADRYPSGMYNMTLRLNDAILTKQIILTK